MKGLVGAFNQEKALVGAFSVSTNLRMDLFQALVGGEFVEVLTCPGPINGSVVCDQGWSLYASHRSEINNE